jgi:hypothetical protein
MRLHTRVPFRDVGAGIFAPPSSVHTVALLFISGLVFLSPWLFSGVFAPRSAVLLRTDERDRQHQNICKDPKADYKKRGDHLSLRVGSDASNSMVRTSRLTSLF